MRTFLPLLLVALTGCSLPGGDYEVRPLGGVDVDGGGDQLYFELRNVAGFASGGWALQLPSDWSERPMDPLDARRMAGLPLAFRASEGMHPDAFALREPIDLRWVPFAAALPAVTLRRPSLFNGFGAAKAVGDSVDVDLLVRSRGPLSRSEFERRTRVTESQDTYFAMRRDSDGVWDLYGALERGTPPDAYRVPVLLATVQLYDERWLPTKVANGTVRATSTLAGLVIFVPAVIVGGITMELANVATGGA